jgi:hypothetical protein
MSMRRFLAIALAFGSLPVYGWGPEGHSLVARIADAQLTAAARARVAEILGPGVTMASISSWADQVRRQRSNTGPWHYVDVPIDKPHLDMARDCAKDDCVVAQIAIERKLLVDPAATPVQRKEALMFLIHFVGDMHQPLHCSDNKDKGGNDVKVVFFDRPGNLHSTWDGGILGRMAKEDDLFPVLLKDAEKRQKKYAKGTVADWAEEAHKAAQKVVYSKLPPVAKGTPEPLGEAYEKTGEPLVKLQIEKAGDRLARILNDTFK